MKNNNVLGRAGFKYGRAHFYQNETRLKDKYYLGH